MRRHALLLLALWLALPTAALASSALPFEKMPDAPVSSYHILQSDQSETPIAIHNPHPAGSLQNPYTYATLRDALQTGLTLADGVYLDAALPEMDILYRVEAIQPGDGFFQKAGWYLTCRPCSPADGTLAGIDTVSLYLPK